jgi:CO/xanthine dehydrogenase Mo-binding subunit
LARAFDWPENRFRVILVPAGGSFGGKDDNVLSVWAALAAYKTDHPVIFSFSRPESMRGHSKRHSMRINHTLGASKDGLLISAKVSIWSDTGAYAHWGENIIRFASLHSIGPYRIPNAFVEANLVYTNNIAAGAMRGWGTPQVSFAAESQMDRLAERLDMHPLKLRWLNALRDGDTMITGALPRGCRFMDTLESAANRIGLDLVSIKQ